LPVLLSSPIINHKGVRVRVLVGAPVFNISLPFSFLPKLCKNVQISPQGNIFGVRPGGLSVIASDGTLLGTIETGQATSNVAWGEDGQTLFITGGSSVYRLRLTTSGASTSLP
jgi:sugar lactone lactonase YvrE